MDSTAQGPSARPDVNIVVCADEYGCGRWYHRGRNADAVLNELREAAAGAKGEMVRVTTAGCILGCTYGPRFDVARRWSGEKALYGSIDGTATVTRRGQVRFVAIPDDLGQVIEDHLPESAVPLATLNQPARPTDIDLLRRVLLDCSVGTDGIPVGLGEAVVMVHNAAATVSIPATLDDLQFVDGSGNPDADGGIAVLTTDGDGRIALQLSRIRRVEFIHRNLGNGMPSYAIWMGDDQLETVYRIYLRRSENSAANPLRHQLFMALIDNYGSTVTF
jgi:hypothetical protein